jgi:predicted secreted protein
MNKDMKNQLSAQLLLLVWVIFPTQLIFAQPDTLWLKTFGGCNNDYGMAVLQTSDGGYIITGSTNSFGAGGSDYWLIKTDAAGDTLWTKTFGKDGDDYGKAARQTSDGGYIITGTTNSFGAGSADCRLIKTDASGNIIWTKTFGGNSNDEGNSVRQTSDDGYIITGYTKSYGAGGADYWLIKTDTSGDTLWTKTFGEGSDDYSRAVLQTSDGGYIIAGYTNSFGADFYDTWLIKTDAAGDTLWTKIFGGNGSSYEECYSVQQTTDGGYIIAGKTWSLSNGASNADVSLIKTDSSGNIIWAKTFGGNLFEKGSCVQQTSDGGYIVTGYTESYGAGIQDVWLIKTDASGNIIWIKTIGGYSIDAGSSVQQTADGGYIITGSTRSFGAGSYDVLLVKIAPDIPKIIPGSASLKDYGRIRVTDYSPVNSRANRSAYIITGNTITVEAWVFPAQLPKKGQNFSIVKRPYYQKEPHRAYELCITNFHDDSVPHYCFAITDGAIPVNGASPSDPNPVKTHSWTHIAGTYDGSMARLYINGILVAEEAFTDNIGAGDTGFYIGGLYQNERFQGLIDEVRLWNVTRTPAEIQNYMRLTLTGDEPGLAGYWPLDKTAEVERNSPVTVDFTDNHNDLQPQFGTEFVNICQFDTP